jgi:hypothetical protein
MKRVPGSRFWVPDFGTRVCILYTAGGMAMEFLGVPFRRLTGVISKDPDRDIVSAAFI